MKTKVHLFIIAVIVTSSFTSCKKSADIVPVKSAKVGVAPVALPDSGTHKLHQ
ncbi:hypothetical protein [Mucilaginibacter sp.]|uniref:hypothetical protein n=1 Tax=Mucilaginibacter sp. TaxID=1882438 RepID=UPI003D12F989